ncbi:DUF1850 domain-containing protein [Desulfotomaculum sp. 1211_IL3151]|uniref:DUF1850 domain-containing protein n=1 Tax=Desulfotomaculum sp. 1211_IL3151 TaxID=3084055 RepID=UPI002FD93996
MKTRKMQRFKIFIFSLLLSILLAVFFIPLPTLLVSQQQGQPVIVVPMIFGKTFTYEYLHSVLKTPVQENFLLAPGHSLLLTSTTFKSYGVGTPFLEGEGELENRNGLFILKGQNRRFAQLDFGVVPFTEPTLIYRGERYNFKDYFKAGSLITLKVKTLTPAKVLALYLEGGKT